MASHQAYEDLKATLKKKKAGETESKPGSPTLETSAAAAVTAVTGGRTLPITHTATPAAERRESDEKQPESESKTVHPHTASSLTPPAVASPKKYLIHTKSILKPKSAAEIAADKEKEDDGLLLTDPIQLDFVTAMLDHFKFKCGIALLVPSLARSVRCELLLMQPHAWYLISVSCSASVLLCSKMLDLSNVVEILRRVKSVLKSQPNVVHLTVTTRLTIVGDLHGQLDDLLAIFKLNGLPSPRNAYCHSRMHIRCTHR
jgi:hypothetical protein